MESSDDSLDGSPSPRGRQRDEVQEIKRASRLSHARSQRVASSRRGPTHNSQQPAYADSAHTASQLHQQQEEMLSARQSSQQFEEAKRLRQALDERERELKECRFEMKQMQSRLNVLQSSEKSLEAKITHATAALKQTCETAEKALEDRKRIVQSECDRLVRLVSGIERHTMHGHHAVASRTTIGLLLKTRHGLENLKKAVLEGASTAMLSAAAIGDAPLLASVGDSMSGQVKADALDGALLDMCKHLEEENMRLESTLAVAQAELQELQRESASSKLIPHYRLAIVRARAHATNLAEQLQRAQDDNRILRDQLERALKDMSSNAVTDLKRTAIYEFLNFKAGAGGASTGAGAGGVGSGGGGPAPSSSASSLFSDPAATELQAKVVQKELADLDAEIESLQRKLSASARAKASTLLVDTLTGPAAVKR